MDCSRHWIMQLWIGTCFVVSMEMSSCLPNPCQNGGICGNRGSIYSCTCRVHYIGKNCAFDKRKYTVAVIIELNSKIITTDGVTRLIIDAINEFCILPLSNCTMVRYEKRDKSSNVIPFGYFWPSQVYLDEDSTIFYPGDSIKTKFFVVGMRGYQAEYIMRPEVIMKALLHSKWTVKSTNHDQKTDNLGEKLTKILLPSIIGVCLLFGATLVLWKSRKYRKRSESETLNDDTIHVAESVETSNRATQVVYWRPEMDSRTPPPYMSKEQYAEIRNGIGDPPPPYHTVV